MTVAAAAAAAAVAVVVVVVVVAAAVVVVVVVVVAAAAAAAGCPRTRWGQTCAFWGHDAPLQASLPAGLPDPWRKQDRTWE